jgi:hypothetical protein
LDSSDSLGFTRMSNMEDHNYGMTASKPAT